MPAFRVLSPTLSFEGLLVLYLLALSVTILALIMNVPQAVHALRTRSAAGVSRISIINCFVSSAAWGVYLVHLSDWPLLAATVAPLLPLGITLFFARRNGGSLLLPAIWASVLLGSFLGGWMIFAAVLSCSVVLFHGPAVVSAWRSTDTSGISRSSWTIAGIEALLSVLYGGWSGNGAVVVYGILATAGSVLVLVACLRSRPQVVDPAAFVPAQRPASPLEHVPDLDPASVRTLVTTD